MGAGWARDGRGMGARAEFARTFSSAVGARSLGFGAAFFFAAAPRFHFGSFAFSAAAASRAACFSAAFASFAACFSAAFASFAACASAAFFASASSFALRRSASTSAATAAFASATSRS